jgi:hypothetical protein
MAGDATDGFASRTFLLFAATVALCSLIPLPFVDRLVANFVRRKMATALASRHGHTLEGDAAAVLMDAPGGGCLGCVWSIVLWPFKKLLKYVLFFLEAKEIGDDLSDAYHRALLLDDAFRSGWLPGDAASVRRAMDGALARVETRPIERAVRGPFKAADPDWAGRIAAMVHRDRERADPDVSPAMKLALGTGALVPEALLAFRVGMGEVPRLETEVSGLIEPELLPADPLPVLAEKPAAVVEDAEEVLKLPARREEEPG